MGILQGWRGDGMCWRSMWDGLSWVVRGCREQYLTHGSKLPHFGHCLETILTSSDGINEITGRDWSLLLGHGGFGIERGGGVPHLIKTQNTAKNLLPVFNQSFRINFQSIKMSVILKCINRLKYRYHRSLALYNTWYVQHSSVHSQDPIRGPRLQQIREGYGTLN